VGILRFPMAILASFRARRLARRAREVFDRGGWAEAARLLDAPPGLAAASWANFAVQLYNAGHRDEAERSIARALALEPERGDALIFLAELQAESDRAPDAIATYRRVLARFPGAVMQALELANLLADAGELEEAERVLSPFGAQSLVSVRVMLAKLRLALGRFEEVVAMTAPLAREMRRELQSLSFGGARKDLAEGYREIGRLHDEAYAALHGCEKVIESAAKQGLLDARAGVNYRLLGQARMAEEPAWAADVTLRSIAETTSFGEALIAAGERSRGLCHLGAAQLRQGRCERARAFFEEARALDDDNFAAYLGIGAVLDLERSRAFEHIADLPVDPGAPPDALVAVVPDWPALDERERRVVVAMAAPLVGLLPRVAAAGGVARLLPVDARLTDLPELQDGGEERFEDHRCLDAITGAATGKVAASKIEDLLNIRGEGHSVFAHELAHLAHHHAPEDVCAEIEALYQRALAEEHVATSYQTTNVAEFFAVAYTDYLAQLYDFPVQRELDEEGIVAETFALIQRLG
jgi:tetratricopeptide (TPR) repeat protein